MDFLQSRNATVTFVLVTVRDLANAQVLPSMINIDANIYMAWASVSFFNLDTKPPKKSFGIIDVPAGRVAPKFLGRIMIGSWGNVDGKKIGGKFRHVEQFLSSRFIDVKSMIAEIIQI